MSDVESYKDALQAWVDWANENETHIASISTMSAVHGLPYRGESYESVLDRSRVVLDGGFWEHKP